MPPKLLNGKERTENENRTIFHSSQALAFKGYFLQKIQKISRTFQELPIKQKNWFVVNVKSKEQRNPEACL